MAKISNSNKQDQVKDYLAKSHDKFKSELQERIQLGEELLSRQILNQADLAKLREDHSFWHDYNAELLKQSFNNPSNSYLKTYIFQPMFLTSSGGYHQSSISELLQEEKSDITNHLNRLKKIFEKVNLIELVPNLLTEKVEQPKDEIAVNLLSNLFSKFHKVAQSLRQRHNNRNTLLINDEYDVQDLLRSLLKINFDDIREEDYTPSYAGSNSRVDFVLKDEKIIIEVKITSDKLNDKEIGSQLLIDIGRYRSHPDCKILTVFIYDKGDFIVNKTGLKNDLEKMSTPELKVKIFIAPD